MKLRYNIWLVLGIMLLSVGFTACENDDDSSDSTPIVVTAVYLEDADSSVPDREVTFIRKGQVMRIEGSGFKGMKRIYVNGHNNYFNPVYVSGNSMLLQVDKETPVIDADPEERNTIHFVKSGTELVYSFAIRDAAPTITRISHTLPLPGETITIYGTGLSETTKVVFPGNVVVTDGIVSDEEGKYIQVAMPDNLTESGSLFVECANGGAYSPAYFNFKAGVILDFDGLGTQGYWGWSAAGSMINKDDLESAVIGTGNLSQGFYCAHRPSRLTEFAQGKNRLTEVWTAGNDVDDWRGQLIPYIPATTPVSQVAFQFDIYVPNEWVNTGFLKICLYNGFNGGEWSKDAYNYVPWIVEKEVVPFKTEGWTTVTIPFSKFYSFSDTEKTFTFENVLVTREDAQWRNFGFYFENSDFKLSNVTGSSADETEFPSSPTSVSVYTDNWRVVSLNTPTYSDFPEDDGQ
ncbi:MAG: glycan-binding surface protein [Breznakibacter sp.]